jgi:MFS family permease
MRGEFYNPSKTIKRNLLLLSLTQALLLVVVQTFIIHVPITIIALGGSTALAGLGVALMWGGRLVTTYQMGRLMDRVGRMPVIMAGLLLMAVTAVVAGLSVIWTLLTPYLFMIVLFGVGRGMADYIRIAAGDILPKERRGFGTGILLTGSLAGTLLATPVIAMVYNVAGGGNLAAMYFYTIPFAVAGFFAALSVRPDPLEIGRRQNVQHVNPSYPQSQVRGLRQIMTSRVVFAYTSSAISTGAMVAFMSLGSLLLHTHHVDIPTISLVVTIHVIGMFAFSIPLGRAADILGRVPVTAAGVLVCSVGTLITAIGVSLPVVTIGMFLIGVGWSAATVASLALIADETVPDERGKAQGFNDMVIALASLATPIIASVILEKYGTTTLGMAGIVSATPALLLAIRLRRGG